MKRRENSTVQHDRRQYFRVNDSVRLSITPVPEEQLAALEERLEQGIDDGFTVMSGLAGISAEMAVSMRRIEHVDPDIAAYLKALDRKIELLGRAFVARETHLLEETVCPVNLSAGGMCVLVNDCYRQGQVLEVRILLLPSMIGVLLYATVVECTPAGEGASESGYGYRLRLAFTHLREQDRDLLIRHALRCQSAELRSKNPKPGDLGE